VHQLFFDKCSRQCHCAFFSTSDQTPFHSADRRWRETERCVRGIACSARRIAGTRHAPSPNPCVLWRRLQLYRPRRRLRCSCSPSTTAPPGIFSPLLGFSSSASKPAGGRLRYSTPRSPDQCPSKRRPVKAPTAPHLLRCGEALPRAGLDHPITRPGALRRHSGGPIRGMTGHCRRIKRADARSSRRFPWRDPGRCLYRQHRRQAHLRRPRMVQVRHHTFTRRVGPAASCRDAARYGASDRSK
jgi:hypothetical protein